MTDRSDPNDRTTDDPAQGRKAVARDPKAERLAEALRANLKRRKSAVRARQDRNVADPSDPSED